MGYYKDLVGKKNGRLRIISFNSNSSSGTQWNAICDCGRLTIVRSDNFNRGQSLSCGCYRAIVIKKKSNENLKRYKFRKYKSGALIRGYSFDLTFDYFVNLISSNCHYCLIKPNPFNGIDRIDNSIGYTIKNSTPCCSLCNMAKGTMSYERFMGYIQRFKLTPNS